MSHTGVTVDYVCDKLKYTGTIDVTVHNQSRTFNIRLPNDGFLYIARAAFAVFQDGITDMTGTTGVCLRKLMPCSSPVQKSLLRCC